MKKTLSGLLSIIFLLILCNFSYSATFSDNFDDQDLNGNWTALIDSWSYQLSLAVPTPGNYILFGDSTVASTLHDDNVALKIYNGAQFLTQNLTMTTVFSVQEDLSGNASAGIAFGLNGSGPDIESGYTSYHAGISKWDGGNYHLSVGDLGGRDIFYEVELPGVNSSMLFQMDVTISVGDNVNVSLQQWISNGVTAPIYSQSFDLGLTSGFLSGYTGLHTGETVGFGYFAVTGDPVPIPGSLSLLCLGLIGLAGFSRKKN